MDLKGVRNPLFAITVILLSGAGLTSCSTPTQAADPTIPTVPVTTATRTDLSNDLTLTAEFIPYQDVDVMAKVSGYVRSIPVDIGDHVHQGELLATLELPEMQNDMARASAAVKEAQSDVVSAESSLSRAQAAHEIAHLSYVRIQDVSHKEAGLVPQEDVDVAHSRDLEAEAELSTAQSSLEAAQDHSTEAQAELDRLKTMYAYTNITAPFTGVITKRYANIGSMIQAGISSQTQAMPVVRLAQDNLLRLILPVPVGAVPQIHVGQAVDVDVKTLGKTFPGKVIRFANNIQSSTRTMDTEVDVPNPTLAIIPGMYAEVRLQFNDRSKVLTLPLDAVEGLGSESEQVYQVGADHVVHIVQVKTGLQTPTRVEIRSGLQDEGVFIVGRHSGLSEGEKVQPREAEYEADNVTPPREK